MGKMKIKPLNDNILIEIEREPETTKSGIIIATDKNVITEKGTVIASNSENIKKGDIIYFKGYSLSPIEVDGKTLHFIKEEDILALS